jgi:flagellar basal-body rod modification protein FlgD
MAAIDPTTGTAPAPSTSASMSAAATAKKAANGLDRDAFMKLMVAQMRYQDPTKPMDSSQFMTQSAQFTNIELLQKLQESQSQLLSYQGLVLSSSLVGKTITGTTSDGTIVTGKVDAANVVAGAGYVTVGSTRLPVANVNEVR